MISVQTSGEESREENRDVKYPPDIINLVVDGVVKRGIIVAINPMKILSRSIRRAFNPTCVMRIKKFVVMVLLLVSATHSSHGQTYGQALNATNLTWTSPFQNPWFVTTIPSQTHDGVSAARSPFLVGSGTSTLQTTINGPGKISFWWNVGFDACTLSFMANSVVQTNIYQWGGWRQETFYFGAGTFALAWVNSASSGSGTAYLDEVTYIPGAFAPEFTFQPLSQSQVQGLDTMMAVAVQGTPPFSYQWRFNGTNISGATNSFVVITNTQQVNLGSYRVVVTNSAGSVTSAVASLEFGEVAAWGQVDSVGWASATNGLTYIMGIAAGGSHNLALTTGGGVLGWGKNFAGETSIPQDLTNVIGLASDSGNCIAIMSNGEIVTWGGDGYGPTGITNKPAGLTNVVSIALGMTHALALKSDGTITAWGNNFSSQTNVPIGLSNVVSVAAGTRHNLAVKADGTISAWGENFFGQANVPVGLSNVVSVAGGWSHSMALKSDGTVRVWGNNTYGQTNAPAVLTNVVAIDAGWYFNVALKSDGTVIAWGYNNYGQTNVQSKLTNVVAISAASSHAIALVANGPPVSNAEMSNPTLSTNGFSVSVPTQSGRVYRLEYKSSLADVEWTALPLVAGNGTNLVLTDSTSPGSQRFYRVRRW